MQPLFGCQQKAWNNVNGHPVDILRTGRGRDVKQFYRHHIWRTPLTDFVKTNVPFYILKCGVDCGRRSEIMHVRLGNKIMSTAAHLRGAGKIESTVRLTDIWFNMSVN